MTRRVWVPATAALLALAGCATTPSVTAGEPTPAAGTPVSAGPGTAVSDEPGASTGSAAASGGAQARTRLATLRTADWSGIPDAGQMDVRFRMGEHCTTIQGPPDHPVLLVWPENSVTVDPSQPGTLRFRDPATGEVSLIRDGAVVDLGGAPVTGTTDYVTPPHESCPTDDVFFVKQVRT